MSVVQQAVVLLQVVNLRIIFLVLLDQTNLDQVTSIQLALSISIIPEGLNQENMDKKLLKF